MARILAQRPESAKAIVLPPAPQKASISVVVVAGVESARWAAILLEGVLEESVRLMVRGGMGDGGHTPLQAQA